MKKTLVICSMALGLTVQGLLADHHESSQTHRSTGTTSEMKHSSMSATGDVRLSKLMDADVKSKDGEDLGSLEDLIINPQTGKIEFAVLGRGGFLGIGEKLVPVPWKAMSIQSEEEFSLNVDKEKLRSAPTIDKNYSNLSTPGYTVTIYQFYAVPQETGGAESPGGTQAGEASTSTEGSSTSESTAPDTSDPLDDEAK